MGFSLIELVVAMVIIGILAALAVPKISGASLKAKIAEGCTVLGAFDKAQIAYVTEAGELGQVEILFIDNPCEDGYSKYFRYSEVLVEDVSSTLSATGRAGMGEVAGDAVSTTVLMSGDVVHSTDPDFDKYLPNW